MSIRVTCTGCHTRFNVSEKFAGREGPCPKCKRVITIPAASEAVQVHAPQEFGPKGASGAAVLKPVFRKEAKVSPVQMVLIGATIIGFVAAAFLMQFGISDHKQFSSLVLLLGAIVLAVPCVYAAYTFLRDSERGALTGQDLWTRVIACAVVYGLTWLLVPLATDIAGLGGGAGTAAGVVAMFVVGSIAAYLTLGIDPLMTVLHYGFYFGCCLLLRLAAGFDVLPGPAEGGNQNMQDLLEASRVLFQYFV
ncbi:MAG: hypothetical protein ACR2NP_12345 [Pirellulaceae bacterium]